MEGITTSTPAKIVDSWVVTLQKLKSSQGTTENIKQKTVKANTEKSYGIFNISYGVIVVDDDSDADKDWGKNKIR